MLRKLELFFALLIGTMTLTFGYEYVVAKPDQGINSTASPRFCASIAKKKISEDNFPSLVFREDAKKRLQH